MRVSAIYSVYPRWRGEHHGNFTADVLALGLSPLARGTRLCLLLLLLLLRFIPAGAGNTAPRLMGRNSSAVYPRWRGEHTPYLHFDIRQTGLSPLARGTPDSEPAAWKAIRFIPAGAGNTSNSPLKPYSRPVYPRWRGEHEIAIFFQ